MDTATPQIGARGIRNAVDRPSGRRLFYTALPVTMLGVVFVGFSQTYYLKSMFGTPELPALYHVHGALFTAWMLLMVLQPALVAAGRVPLHRRIGAVGGWLAAAMAIAAFFVSVDQGRRGAAPPGIPPLAFMAVPFASMVVFPVLVAAALWWRQAPAIHKRLMLLATMELIPAGVGRWPVLSQGGPLVFFGGADLALIALLLHDRITTGRVHRATAWGGLFLVASQVLRVLVGGTTTWQTFARWLIA